MSAKDSLKGLYDLAHYKHQLPPLKMAIQGWLGGAFLSFGGLLASSMASGFINVSPGLVALIYTLVFPCGLVLIIIGQVDLFTSNCLIFTVAILFDIKTITLVPNARKRLCISDALLFLINSWLWNLFGSLCISYFLVLHGDMITSGSNLSIFFINSTRKKLNYSTDAVFVRGISANMLVCIAVYLSTGAKDTFSKIILIWIPIAIFVGIGGEHCVANMFTIPTGILASNGTDTSINWESFLLNNIFQVTIGNFLGAVVIAISYFILYGEDTKIFITEDLEFATERSMYRIQVPCEDDV